MPFFGVPLRNGVSLGLGTVAGLGGASFSPLDLFLNNEPGFWYDLSDFSTLYQNASGTTPVTALEQPVGRVLDKSRSLVLGAESAINGSFETDTNWSKATGWSISGGQALYSGAGGANLTQTSVVANEKTYRVVVDVASVTGAFTVRIGDGAFSATSSFALTSGIVTATVLSNGPNITIRSDGGTAIAINSISVKELAGAHATQGTDASRPVLSARYNLFTYTEDFNNASGWTKASSAGVTQPVMTATQVTNPIGGASSIKIDYPVVSAANAFAIFFSTTTTQVFSTAHKAAIYLRGAVGGEVVWLSWTPNGTTYTATQCALTTAWQRFELPYTTSASGLQYVQIGVDLRDTNQSAKSAQSIYAWGADLRVANDGVGLPIYQRVTTSTDYDSLGFLPYLRFDGTDDSLTSSVINFTATDQMSVFAGVRKLSDTAGVYAELGPVASTTNGTFWLGPYTGYGYGSRGTVYADAVLTPTTAPRTDVLTGLSSISGDLVQLRIDGVLANQDTGDQGTGNYASYAVYIGRRNNATDPTFFRLYSMIVRGAATNTLQVEQTESWVNQYTGAY